MHIPAVDQPTTVSLPDGTRIILKAEIDCSETAQVADNSDPGPAWLPPPQFREKDTPKKVAREKHPTAKLLPKVDTARPAPDDRIMDNPAIGGRVTAFVLCYGDFFDLHVRCLKSILKTTDRKRLELRVAGNSVGESTRRYIQELVEDDQVSVFYDSKENRRKYPVMRDIFRDSKRPIKTRWLLWFDDDTLVDRNDSWLQLLAAQIVSADMPKLGGVGVVQNYQLNPKQLQTVQAAPWYRGRPFRDRRGKPVANGNTVHFLTGSFWAMKTECIETCDIPAALLGHNGGDVLIGEQLWQGGYSMKHWQETTKKQIINWSSAPRRGLNEKHWGTG